MNDTRAEFKLAYRIARLSKSSAPSEDHIGECAKRCYRMRPWSRDPLAYKWGCAKLRAQRRVCEPLLSANLFAEPGYAVQDTWF